MLAIFPVSNVSGKPRQNLWRISAVGHFSYQAVVEPLVHCWYQSWGWPDPLSLTPPQPAYHSLSPSELDIKGLSSVQRGRKVRQSKERSVLVIGGWIQLRVGVHAQTEKVDAESASSP